MPNKKKRIMGWMMVLAMVAGSFTPASVQASDQAFHVNPIENMSDDFIKGADISMLYEIEEKGGKYKNDKGEVEDLLKILKDSGVNWVRLRLWNDPYDVAWSDKVTTNGEKVLGAIGGGTNDLERTIAISKRAQALGLKVLLDFHYSDFWADPGKQYKPKAWEDLTGADLENALYDYTKTTLEKMKAQGTLPEMVQVGNEINGGMVWPDGKGVTSTRFINLLKQGTQAVRDVDSNIEIMLHLAEGGSKGTFIHAFDAFTNANIDYDIIGASFYSFWHGTLNDLQDNLDTISQRYDKDVIVAETAYGYTLENFDMTGNNFDAAAEEKGGYRASVQGQATAMKEVMEAVVKVPDNKGRGIFYWEPAWIPVEGAGWLTGEGSGWENQAMFDQYGQALPSLNVFNLVSDPANEFIDPIVVSAKDIVLSIESGNGLELPEEVDVTYSDGAFRKARVNWEETDETKFDLPGKYAINGLVNGYNITAHITVKGTKNLVKNPGFESDNLDPWVVSSNVGSPLNVKEEPGNVHTGSSAMNYWSSSDFRSILKQEVTGIEDGSYVLKAWLMGESEGESATTLFAESGGIRYAAKAITKGWNNWNEYELKDIQVVDGKVTIGMDINEKADSWGWIDDFVLIKDDTKGLIEGPESIKPGALFDVAISVGSLIDTAYAGDTRIKYDATLFELIEVTARDSNTIIAEEMREEGKVRIITAHTKGIEEEDLFVLKFKAKDIKLAAEGKIEAQSIQLSSAPKGQIMHVANLPSYNVKLVLDAPAEPEDPEDPVDPVKPVEPEKPVDPEKPVKPEETEGDDSGNSSSSTSSGGPNKEASPKVSEFISSHKLDKKTGNLLAKVDGAKLEEEFNKIEKKEKEIKEIIIEMPNQEGIQSFSLELPGEILQSKVLDKKIKLKLPFGTVTLPNTMFNNQKTNLQQISLKTKIVEDKTRKNKPMIELEVLAGGKVLSWKNESAQVEVAVNYTPEKEEKENLEHLVIYYIDTQGEFIKVPNASYDEETQQMIFKTAHFSQYLVGYDYRTFTDLDRQKWAKKSIEVLASRGVIRDSYKDEYHPEEKIGRGEFYDMIISALGLSAKAGSNFADVGDDTYYAKNLGIAKELGIAIGTGDNKLEPSKELTRQDAIIIIERTLEVGETTTNPDSEHILIRFLDREDISEYAVDSIARAVNEGIVHGNGIEGALKMMPKETLSKAEAVALVYKRLNIK